MMEGFAFADLCYLAVNLPQEVNLYKFNGDFEGEIACIDRLLERTIPMALRKRLEIERVFAAGLQMNYQTDDAAMLKGLRERYPQASQKTLDELIGMGNVDFIMKNGARYFENGALSNIFLTHSDYLNSTFAKEQEPASSDAEKPRDIRQEVCDLMQEEGGCAYRFEVEETLRVLPAFDRPGERIRLWFPYPVACATQSDIRLLSSSHPVQISDSPIRTAMIETAHVPETVYSVRFSYVNHAKYTVLDPDKVCGQQPDMPAYLCEQYPHIRFTPYVRAVAKEIAGDEKNSLLLAHRVYDWIRDHVSYSYVRDYLYIENIPEFVMLNGYGDCGTMALVFITLCRCLGIPAKWQSGSAVRPDHIGSHDWAMFYIAPYGWLYCDPSYGNTSDPEKHAHYFGNLDPFRLVACNEFQVPFTPDKKYLRMDPYDNQSGEAEYATENLFFGQLESRRRVISAQKVDFHDFEC